MDYRQLGYSGLKVSELSFGTATFGGGAEFFRAWGETDVNEAKRLIDICLQAGVNLFDTADIYSNGQAEEILGQSNRGQAAGLVDFHENDIPVWWWTERRWIVSPSYSSSVRGQPAPLGYGLHRHLPHAWFR
jgi:hypothetical protein